MTAAGAYTGEGENVLLPQEGLNIPKLHMGYRGSIESSCRELHSIGMPNK